MSINTERLGIAVLVTLVAIGVLLAFVARGSGALLSDADSVVWLLLVVALAGALLRRRWSDAVFIFLATPTAALVGLQLPPEGVSRKAVLHCRYNPRHEPSTRPASLCRDTGRQVGQVREQDAENRRRLDSARGRGP